MKPVKAILIDSKKREVRAITLTDSDRLKELQSLVGGLIERGVVDMLGEDCLYINETGLINGTTEFFCIQGAYQPYAGNGVIVGTMPNGDDTDPVSSVEYIQSIVKFTDGHTLALALKLGISEDKLVEFVLKGS